MARWLLRLHLRKSEQNGKEPLEPLHLVTGTVVLVLQVYGCGVLALESVSVRDNFFALGGHSLLAAQVIYRLQEVCDQTLTLKDLFERPTIEELAQVLTHQTTGARKGAGAIERQDAEHLLVNLERLSDEEVERLFQTFQREEGE